MKKVLILFACLGLLSMQVFAQRTVTGTVTSSDDGVGLPGVSVLVKGTQAGTITDLNGKYSVDVPEGATTLIFQFMGMKTQEVGITSDVIDVAMESGDIVVDDVVVTAYGIKRAPKGSTSLNQVVSGERLTEVRQPNVNNALAGKVAGIQVLGQSAGKLDATGSIRLRGEGGFSTGQGVLYVVDGTIITNPADINMDNVEQLNVLSGPAASALLGPQGANGAIIISTKKAKEGQKGIGIEINTGLQFSKVYIMPEYQNSYAGGSTQDFIKFNYAPNMPAGWQALDGKYYHDYSDDASWGPRMVGQEYIPWYAWYDGTKYSYKTTTLDPQPDNSRDFFQTGITENTSIAFSKGTEKMNIRATYNNIHVKGLIPNSTLNKNIIGVRSTFNLTNKLTVGANINFSSTHTVGEFDDGYSNQSTGSFNQWFHRDVDMGIMKELKDLRTAEGIYASWNHNNPTSWDPANTKKFYAGNYWYNFYTWFDLVTIPKQDDRLFGDVSLSYEIIKDLSIRATVRKQLLSQWGEYMYSSDLNESGSQTTGNSPEAKGFYRSYTQYSDRTNYEMLLTYSKTFGGFKINANAGSDFYDYELKYNNAQTVDGFSVPNLYAISNSKSQPSITNTRYAEKYNALFLRADAGYKDFAFIDFTLRNDWFSTLPEADNSVFSKSIGASFVFSDLLKIPVLSRAKIRAGWGEIPTTIGIYAYPGQAYSVNQYQWNGNFLMSTPNGLVDPNIKGAVKTQKELGIELGFIDNRILVTATYWDGTERDIPYNISITGFSGFSQSYLNTGEIAKKGLDVTGQFIPIQNDAFRWELNTSFGYLIDNEIVKIAEGIDRFTVQGRWTNADGSSRGGAPVLVHEANSQWGQLIGGGIKYYNGKQVLDANGLNVSDPQTHFGGILPKYTGGLQSSLKFLSDFYFTFSIDYQVGGKYFSLSDMWGTYSGLMARTAGLNDLGNPVRDPVADGGGVHVTGVTDVQDYDANPDGAPIYEDIDMYVEGQLYFHSFYEKGVQDYSVFDRTYVKLRELSIGYNLPIGKFGWSKWINSANFAIVAQNPWLIYAKNRDFDPSEIAATDGESGQYPGVRTLGFNLKLSF
ncbi:MAG: SusC/RagA family TonB-linked outer membrane protein [Bacteroidales bacterium]